MAGRRSAIGIWLVALVAYGAFVAWYGGLRGPLTRGEIEGYLGRLAENPNFDPAQLGALRAFLEADDGREFFMVNLLRMQPGEVEVPGGGGAREPAPQVMERYSRPFLRKLLLRAGHPAFVARAAATYLERWNVEPDPGWTAAGVIRYRSRRDLVEIVLDPAFDPIHAYKIVALANTLAFPATPAVIWVGPRVWAALFLALVAALTQLAFTSAALRRARRPA